MKNLKRSFAGIAGMAIILAAALPCMAARKKVGDGLSLQQAIDDAQPGDVLALSFDFHPGGVVINGKSDIEIRGGAGTVMPFPEDVIGIHIINSTNITLNGFVIRNFERAIVLENSSFCTIKRMRIDTNFDKPNPDAGFLADGIVLIDSHQNDISLNEIFNSGNNGILLTENSSGNMIRSNNIYDNGSQTDGLPHAGAGIALDGGDQIENMITRNKVTGNRWGIYLGLDGASSDNQITGNTCSGNKRAGIAVRGGAEGNLVKGNSAAGNHLLDLAPSHLFDIFDDSAGCGNTYERNKGALGGPCL